MSKIHIYYRLFELYTIVYLSCKNGFHSAISHRMRCLSCERRYEFHFEQTISMIYVHLSMCQGDANVVSHSYTETKILNLYQASSLIILMIYLSK